MANNFLNNIRELTIYRIIAMQIHVMLILLYIMCYMQIYFFTTDYSWLFMTTTDRLNNLYRHIFYFTLILIIITVILLIFSFVEKIKGDDYALFICYFYGLSMLFTNFNILFIMNSRYIVGNSNILLVSLLAPIIYMFIIYVTRFSDLKLELIRAIGLLIATGIQLTFGTFRIEYLIFTSFSLLWFCILAPKIYKFVGKKLYNYPGIGKFLLIIVVYFKEYTAVVKNVNAIVVALYGFVIFFIFPITLIYCFDVKPEMIFLMVFIVFNIQLFLNIFYLQVILSIKKTYEIFLMLPGDYIYLLKKLEYILKKDDVTGFLIKNGNWMVAENILTVMVLVNSWAQATKQDFVSLINDISQGEDIPFMEEMSIRKIIELLDITIVESTFISLKENCKSAIETLKADNERFQDIKELLALLIVEAEESFNIRYSILEPEFFAEFSSIEEEIKKREIYIYEIVPMRGPQSYNVLSRQMII